MVRPAGEPSRRTPATAAAQTATGHPDADDRAGQAAAVQLAAAMVHGYDYLARIWLDGPLRIPEAALRAWLADLMSVDAGLAERWAELVRLLDLADERTAADEDYQGCLVIPQPGRYVPPYASVWLDGAEDLWSPTTARVLACYQQAGLDWTAQQSPGHARFWVLAPDHLGVECAFVAELAAGSPEGAADPAAMAADFITGHLRRWVPTYAEELARHAGSRYWRGMAEVLAAWVQLDPLTALCGASP
jgi:TorA maturation chaperone TorD